MKVLSIQKGSNGVERAMEVLSQERLIVPQPIPFADFITSLRGSPVFYLRNVFQLINCMIEHYVDKKEGEGFFGEDGGRLDLKRLFTEDVVKPFYADPLFHGKLLQLSERLKSMLQNRIYVFRGNPGAGKSLFLTNFLKKLQSFSRAEDGKIFKVLWRLDKKTLGMETAVDSVIGKGKTKLEDRVFQRLFEFMGRRENDVDISDENGVISVACPYHCHPIQLVPLQQRKAFLDSLLRNDEFKFKIFYDKEYEWVFQDEPCRICNPIFRKLLEILGSVPAVLKMVYVQPYEFDRQLGIGIQVGNPGDKKTEEEPIKNSPLQNRLNRLFKDSQVVQVSHSTFAFTNNGVRALMDVKGNNVSKIIDWHNIASEGINGIKGQEEYLRMFLVAVANYEDLEFLEEEKYDSLRSRITMIDIPYVRDPEIEIQIYRDEKGKNLDIIFLPEVLLNFSRIVISSRLSSDKNDAFSWLNLNKYSTLFPDKNMLLLMLKMELFGGRIPSWLDSEDRKKLTPKKQKEIIKTIDKEGFKGFSGRDSLQLLSDLIDQKRKKIQREAPINMADVVEFFKNLPDREDRDGKKEDIPPKFLEALTSMYDFEIINQIKEALYAFNPKQIGMEVSDYLFAINFDPDGQTVKNPHTGREITINASLLNDFENRILGDHARTMRTGFRVDMIKRYTSEAMQEMRTPGVMIGDTELFRYLKNEITAVLKQDVLNPLRTNANFRTAIKEFGTASFNTFDKGIKEGVARLFNELSQKFGYTREGAREVCLYAIDKKLVEKHSHD